MNETSLPACRHTQELSFTPVQVIFRVYVLPCTCLAGLLANICNAYVFSHKKMRNQLVNWFLFCLAISDALVLVTSFFVFCMPVIAEYAEDQGWVAFAPDALTLFYPLAHTAHTCSVYLTVFVSVHRYLGVCHPFLVRRISNAQTVKKVILSAALMSILFNLTRWKELRSIPCYSEVYHSESRMIAPTMFMINRTYTIVYRNAIYTLFMFILPFTILTWVNCRIVAVLKLSKYIRRKMTNRTATDEASCTSLTVKSPNHLTVDMNKNKEAKTLKEIRKARKENSITIMLVAMVTGFIYFNMLAFVNNIFELLDFHTIITGYYTLMVEGSTFLVCINGASTIIIYLLFSSKYRIIASKLMHDLFCESFLTRFCVENHDSNKSSISLIKPRPRPLVPPIQRHFCNTLFDTGHSSSLKMDY